MKSIYTIQTIIKNVQICQKNTFIEIQKYLI